MKKLDKNAFYSHPAVRQELARQELARQERNALIVRLYADEQPRWRVAEIRLRPDVRRIPEGTLLSRQMIYAILRQELGAQGRRSLLRARGVPVRKHTEVRR